MIVDKSIQISADPDKIWPYLTDPKKIQMWFNTFKKCEYASEKRSGTGTIYYVEEKVPGPLRKINFEAIKWDENKQLKLLMRSGKNVKSYEIHFIMEPNESGTMLYFLENVGMPFGFIGKILGALSQRMADSMVEEMLIELKNLTENKRPIA